MRPSKPSPALSVVIPVYNAEATIGPLTDVLLAQWPDGEAEVVLVNDGSRDGSHAACLDCVRRHPGRAVYLRLARNFGEHNAVMAGLRQARGNHVLVMDDDFQNPPEEAPKLLEAAVVGGYDVVYGAFREKRHSLFRNLCSAVNDLAARRLLGKPPHVYLSSFKCLSRFLTDRITAYGGPHPYVDGLILQTTDNIGQITVEHRARDCGQSGYTLAKLMRLWLTMFVNFSVAPLRVASILGLGAGGLGLGMGAWSLASSLFDAIASPPWTGAQAMLVALFGLQFLLLGLLGEYLGHALLEVNRAPQFVIREIHGDALEKIP